MTGRLRHRVTLQRPVTSRDTYGDAIESWVDVATVWAAMEDLSGREYWAAAQQASEVTTRVTIRYRDGVHVTWRIVHAVTWETYQIHAILDPDGRRRELQLLCGRAR